MCRVQACQDLQLLELLGISTGSREQVRQFFTRWNHARSAFDCTVQRIRRCRALARIAQTQRDEVVGVGNLIVEGEGAVCFAKSRVDVAVAVARQRELVAHGRGAVVELKAGFEGLSGSLETLLQEQDIAERLEWARRRRVQCSGSAKVSSREVQISSTAVGFATPESRQHGVGPDGDRSAEVFDGGER